MWLGHASSIAQRVLERLDAAISESDDEGRTLNYGKAAAVCAVGIEDRRCRAIPLIDMPSARWSRRISAQSSTPITSST